MANESDRDTVHGAIAELQRLSDLFQRRRVELARRVGLTEQQWRVLERISDEHFMPSMFARESESSPAAVSKTIRQLLDKGLIAVSISEADGRQREYELTPYGKKTMTALRKHRNRAIAAIWAPMSEKQLKDFRATAARLTARIEAFAAEESEE